MTRSVFSLVPNAITVMRLLLVLPIAFFIVDAQYTVALLLFALAGLSDGLDGLIARRFGWESAFGKLIDPLADKLMMITTAITLGLLDHFPVTLMLLMIAKELAVLGGVFAYTTVAGFPRIQPTWTGKLTTAVQIVLLVAVLFNLVQPALLPAVLFTVWFWVVALMTALDGISYLWIWTWRLVDDPRWNTAAG